MYNLAHIHVYEEMIKQDIDRSIELLIKSSNEFEYSFNLLCIILIKRYGFKIERIQHEIDKQIEKTNEIHAKVSAKINLLINLGELYVDSLYETYRNKDFLYDVLHLPICSSDLLKKNKKNPNLKDISKDFYEGVGYDLINRDSKSQFKTFIIYKAYQIKNDNYFFGAADGGR